jgi:DNA-binding transcriptional regulator/RsmH inhibitor MraZ
MEPHFEIGLIGKASAYLSAKGRTVIPAMWQGVFEDRAYVSRDGDSSERYLRLSPAACEGAYVKPLRSQSRFVLTPEEREHIGVSPGGLIIVVGCLDHVELWKPEVYERSMAEARKAWPAFSLGVHKELYAESR